MKGLKDLFFKLFQGQLVSVLYYFLIQLVVLYRGVLYKKELRVVSGLTSLFANLMGSPEPIKTLLLEPLKNPRELKLREAGSPVC